MWKVHWLVGQFTSQTCHSPNRYCLIKKFLRHHLQNETETSRFNTEYNSQQENGEVKVPRRNRNHSRSVWIGLSCNDNESLRYILNPCDTMSTICVGESHCFSPTRCINHFCDCVYIWVTQRWTQQTWTIEINREDKILSFRILANYSAINQIIKKDTSRFGTILWVAWILVTALYKFYVAYIDSSGIITQ